MCEKQLVSQDKEARFKNDELQQGAHSHVSAGTPPCPAPQNIFLLSRRSLQLSHIVEKITTWCVSRFSLALLSDCGRAAADVAYCSSCLLGGKQEKDKFIIIFTPPLRGITHKNNVHEFNVCMCAQKGT